MEPKMTVPTLEAERAAPKLLTKNEKISLSMRGNRNSERHGHTRRHPGGVKDSPTYRSWMAMRTRCNGNGRDNADRYVDRGVTVCERWDSFSNFLLDMGERPTGTTLDRWPNGAGNYEPGNCRWATPREQARNTRRNKLTLETATEVAVLRLKGEKLRVIAERFGISENLPTAIIKGRCWPDALEEAKKIVGEKP